MMSRSGSDIARLSDPLIVDAAEPQAPDPEINGGELVLDDPPLARSNAELERQDILGHKPDDTASATGQEAGGSTSDPWIHCIPSCDAASEHSLHSLVTQCWFGSFIGTGRLGKTIP